MNIDKKYLFTGKQADSLEGLWSVASWAFSSDNLSVNTLSTYLFISF